MDGLRASPAVTAALVGLLCGGVAHAKPVTPPGPVAKAPSKTPAQHGPTLPKVDSHHTDVTAEITKPTDHGPLPGFTPVIAGLTPFGSGPHHGGRAGPKVDRLIAPKAARKGHVTSFRVAAESNSGPVSGVSFDFGEAGGRYAESQCKVGGGRPRGHKAAAKSHHATFGLPYAFASPGPHNVRFEVTSGGCAAHTAATAGQITVDVADAGASLRAITGPLAGVLSTDCPGADVVPTSATRTAARLATNCLLDKVRAKAGLRGLQTLRILRRAAARHSRSMVDQHYFDHTEPSGSTLASRLRAVGFKGSGGENIGYGTAYWATPRSMMWLWMHSSGHRANILDRGFRYVGVAISLGSPTGSKSDGATYTVDFGGS
jgi:uncharacterized protein YkwD